MRLLLLACMIGVLAAAATATAAVPQTLSYQGVLKDSEGNIVPDDSYSITFRIYDVDSGGVSLWSETLALSVTDGIFNAILGTSSGINLPFDTTYYLGIEVGEGGELAPRIELTSAPYARRAALADSTLAGGSGPDPDWQYSGDNIYRLSGRVGIGISTPYAKLDVLDSDGFPAIKAVTTGADWQVAITAQGSSVGGTGLEGYGGHVGVQGNGTSGTGFGIIGFSDTCGVYGYCMGGFGRAGYGVFGNVDSPSGIGVCGKNGFGGYAGYFAGKTKVTSDLEVGNIARIQGTTWPASGKSMELAYSSTFHKGYIQVYDRAGGPSAWGDLYLGGGKVGIGTAYPARTLHIVDVMRLEPRSDYPSNPSDGDLCVVGAGGARHIYCYLNGGWRQLD
jgi:hypothetical protein